LEERMSLGPWIRPVVLLACVAMGGCGQWTEDRVQELRVLQGTRATGSAGVARVKIPLTSADKSLLMQVSPQAGFRTLVTHIEDEDGNTLIDFSEDIQRSRQRTGAAYAKEMTMLNWPIGLDDPFLSGDGVVVVVAAVDKDDALNANVRLDIQSLLKADTDWASGALNVSLFYAGAMAQDEEVKAAVSEAVVLWTEVYADVGVEVVIEVKDWDEGTLPKPGEGSPEEYLALSSASPIRTVNVVIVGSVFGSESLLGAAGGIPGALSPTSHSAVVISASANAGPDLEFDALEVRLLSETLSHEVGHYLGLFHPVENTWDRWDSLSDTEDCDDQQVCEDELGSNVMFPYPVCEDQLCESQDLLTEAQEAVVHRYAGLW
jgi:hypothetical protein